MPTIEIPDELREAFDAAADNDLFRECRGMGVRSVFRRRDGRPVNHHAVVRGVAGGMYGQFAKPEMLPDGTIAERLDLSDYGLDWYVDNLAE